MTATTDRAVVLTDHEMTVYDQEGKPTWKLASVNFGDDDYPNVQSDDSFVYSQLKDGSVTARDWRTGDEKWRFDTSAVDSCAPAARFALARSGRRSPTLTGDDPLVLVRTASRSEDGTDAGNEIDDDQLPASCTRGSNSSAGTAVSLIGIDRKTGKQAWVQKDSRNRVVRAAASSPDGSSLLRLVSSRWQTLLDRTDLKTGQTQEASLSGGTPDILANGANITEVSEDEYYLSFVDETQFAQVDRWGSQKSPGTGASDPQPDGVGCEIATFSSQQGYVYCLLDQTQETSASGAAKYSGRLISGPAGTAPGGKQKTWTYSPVAATGAPSGKDTAGEDVGEDSDDTGEGAVGSTDGGPMSMGDALIPREGKSPLVVVRSPISIDAVDLATGEKEWSQQVPTIGSSPSAAVRFVPGVNEIVVPGAKEVTGLDALTGKRKWSEDFNGSVIGMVTGGGGFIDVKIDSEESPSSRLRAVQHG